VFEVGALDLRAEEDPVTQGTNPVTQLDVLNLFNSKDHDIDYFYVSRLPGEPIDGVADVHFHPVEPRTLRATLQVKF
jgi:hypothetical protein